MGTGDVTFHILIKDYDLVDLPALETKIEAFLAAQAGAELTEFTYADHCEP